MSFNPPRMKACSRGPARTAGQEATLAEGIQGTAACSTNDQNTNDEDTGGPKATSLRIHICPILDGSRALELGTLPHFLRLNHRQF